MGQMGANKIQLIYNYSTKNYVEHKVKASRSYIKYEK